MGSMDGGASGGADGGHCSGSPEPISFVPDQQQVLIVLDRSTEMSGTTFGPQDTELSAALTALSAEINYYAPISGPGHGSSKPTISFSYLDFPDIGSDCTGNVSCCAGNVSQTSSSDDLVKDSNLCSSNGMTCVQSSTRPTAIALAKARTAFPQSSATQNTEKFVLLVTGGDPSDGCPLPNSMTGSAYYCQDAIKTVADLADAGIDTYIVGMGDQTNVFCLTSMASSTSSAFYYSATDESALTSTLTSIFGSTGISANSCRLTLSPAVTSANQLEVWYNGTPVNQDHTNGWSLDSSGTHFRLNGNSCQNFLKNESSGQFALQISQMTCNQHAP